MSKFPNIKTQCPLNPKIKSFIDYYYFLNNKNKKEYLEFWHYPHYKSTLVIFKNAEIKAEKDINYIASRKENNYTCVYNNNVKKPKKEILVGAYDIVGIVFNPLGFNYFQSLINQNPEGLLRSDIDEIFKTDSLSDKTKLLDYFFENMHQDLKIPVLEKTIEILQKRKGDIGWSELETRLNMSRRNLLRHFKLHLGCSFRDFKAVLKFRIALEQGTQETKKLSHLAYDSNYFDQSDLTKGFVSKTNETPKKLFKNIKPITQNLLWKFK